MVKIGIIACKVAMDSICLGCAKCFRAVNRRDGNFASLPKEEVEVVFLTSCGGCPGLITIKMDSINRTLLTLDEKLDMVYMGTCIQRAVENFNCPIDLGFVKSSLENMGIKVYIGTHSYPVFTSKTV